MPLLFSFLRGELMRDIVTVLAVAAAAAAVGVAVIEAW